MYKINLWVLDFLMEHPALVLWLNRYYDWRNRRAKARHKCMWRCVRDGGGGLLITPKPMTQDYAVAWVNRVTGGEVFHVDFEMRHIFYRSAGQMRLTD